MQCKQYLISIALAIACAFSLLYSQTSEVLIDSAWQAWNRNDQPTVENFFRTALEIDKNNVRAYVGLYYLYSAQQKFEEASHELLKVLPLVNSPDSYIYAAWQVLLYRSQNFKNRTEIINLFNQLVENPSTDPALRGTAQAALGEYYESQNKLEKSEAMFSSQHTIDAWSLIGPFENMAGAGYEKIFSPERQFNQQAVYEGKNGIPTHWFGMNKLRRDRWIDMTQYFANNRSVFYANCFVYSPEKQIIRLGVGTSGSLKTFVNDNPVLQCEDENNNDIDTYIVHTELQKGWNRILIKVGYSEIARCNFMVRLFDTLGLPLQGIRVTTDDQIYPKNPKVQSKHVEIFAEKYFADKIRNNPQQAENYLLLADCHLRNDKAVEAELTLRNAIKIFPTCAVILLHQIEAYTRGQKSDEVAKIFERLYSLDSKIPDVLIYRITRSMQNEDYEEAEKEIRDLEKLMPGSEAALSQRIRLYSQKQQSQKVLECSRQAYEQYPLDWSFVRLFAYTTLQATHDNDRAIKIITDYVANVYSKDALKELAQLYLQASKKTQWENTYKKMIVLEPSNPNYLFDMASVYLDMRDFGQATNAINQALAMCPSSSLLWAKLAEIQFAEGKKKMAAASCARALECDPGNLHARDLMRECEDKGNIYRNFDQGDIKSLVKHAPNSVDYPNDPAVILLDDTKRILYGQGATEYTREMLLKIFNNRGIDMLKEYDIDYHDGIEDLIVEKAVVMKKDGSEIKADINDGRIIFKTLEPEDIYYIRWKVRQTRINMLTSFFNESMIFNGILPVKMSRYSLLVTDTSTSNRRACNFCDSVEVRKTSDGILYTWTVTNEPAIEPEPAMPPLTQCGKVLTFSNIPSWHTIVDWYYELAYPRTKITFEIQEQVAELFKEKKQWTIEEKVQKIYNFIVTNIRYSSVPFRQSGIIPQKARDVLVNRLGDCKDVATLAVAMLREAGITAFHVLTRTRSWGSNPDELPSIGFNHCIIGIQTEQGIQFSDLTAQYHPFGSVPNDDHGAFCLLIKPDQQRPLLLDPKQWLPNNVTRTIRGTVKSDNSISLNQVSRYSGALIALSRMMYAEKGSSDQQKQLTNFLTEDFPNVQLKSLEFKNLDNLEPIFELHYAYDISNYLTEAGPFKTMKLPWTGEFKQTALVALEKRKFPLLAWFDTDTLTEEISIELPSKVRPIELPPATKFSCSTVDYSEELSFAKNILNTKRRVVFKNTTVPVEEYAAFRDFMNRLAKEDGKQILLGKKQ